MKYRKKERIVVACIVVFFVTLGIILRKNGAEPLGDLSLMVALYVAGYLMDIMDELP